MAITVYFEDVPVCRLTGDPERFLVYDDAWRARPNAFPVSLAMPLSDGAAPAARALPWLANLLPETQLAEIGQIVGVSPQDVLGLLLRIGRDTAGALSIGAPRAPGEHRRAIPDERALVRILDELPQKPFLVAEEGVSMSLAGVQQKLAIVYEGGRFYLPLEGAPSTHILKPDARHLPGSVWNEAFCMTLARLAGLDVADVETGRAGARAYLLVTRYDRVRTPAGWARIHQEDLCQLLGRWPIAKYERGGPLREPGPGIADLFAAVGAYVSPGARLALMDALVVNVLLCNTDAHAKNYSVLIGAGGGARLAPLYDLVCAALYPRVDRLLPQAINGRTDPAELHGFDWRALARAVGLSPARTLDRVKQIAATVEARAQDAAARVAAMPAGDDPILERLVHAVTKRCRRIARQAEVVRG
ncbi:type II toxin-antitoxin system HipA family toxin [Salinarimonas sp.]|uniref:type II toxin-antitoxin system HipA family toxin n=1 Tax=Salinarimonas sp. TaxID=2766526 RepID=UPI0032D9946B